MTDPPGGAGAGRGAGPASTPGVVLRVDTGGSVRSVLLDDPGIVTSEEADFRSIVAPGSRAKADNFLEALRRESVAIGWELLVPADPPQPFYFAGGRVEADFLVIGAGTEEDVLGMYQELMAITNEQTNVARDAAREAARVASYARDPVTRLSRVNNELVNLQRELARKNAELERLNEQKDRLLGMAAHDLRNPLGVIQAYAEFLLDGLGPDLEAPHLEFLRAIESSSEFMLRLVDELLDLTAIESGRVALEVEDVDLVALLEHAVGLNRVLADEKEVAIELDTAGCPPDSTARLDEAKLHQILDNLLSNAAKFSPAGSTVEVRAAVVDDGVAIEVEDEGPGIPEDEIDGLFEPFTRTSVRATGGEASTGLGLAITKRIVDAHGGEITAENGEVGALFRVRLPLDASQAVRSARTGRNTGAGSRRGL